MSRSGEQVSPCENVIEPTVKHKISAGSIISNPRPASKTSITQPQHKTSQVRKSVRDPNTKDSSQDGGADGPSNLGGTGGGENTSGGSEMKKGDRKGSWHAHISLPSREDEVAAGGQSANDMPAISFS